MTEINEKDLEQATGGIIGQMSGCEKFEFRDGVLPFNAKICVNCKHFLKGNNRLDIYSGKCDLQIDEGE